MQQEIVNPQPNPTNQPNPAPGRKVYRGKAENQRDQNAIREEAPARQKPRNQGQKTVPARLPPPTQKARNVGAEITTASPADASLFSLGMSVREDKARTTFTPAATALCEIARSMTSEMMTDDTSLQRVFVPEYMSYYSVAMYWCRIVTLKMRNSQPLTLEEQDLLQLIQYVNFNIPEPLMLALRSVGNVVTRTGQHLYPAFPPLPTGVIQGLGGHYGALAQPAPGVDNTTHNLYEEIPCLGVPAYAIKRSLSNAPHGRYDSIVTLDDQQPNHNLLGFEPLAFRRNECKNLGLNVGINENDFPDYPRNTAFNIDLLIAISDILANVKTFRMSPTVFSTLTETGAISQTIIARPELQPNDDAPAVTLNLLTTSLTKESEAIFGSGLYFCTQLMKESIGNNHTSWSMFPNPPQAWIDNRNARRNLPEHYYTRVFSTISQHAAVFRLNVMKTIVLTKR